MKKNMPIGSRVFSGVQPSGNLHLGNYLGALKQWVVLQNNNCVIASPQGAAISARKDCFAEPRNDEKNQLSLLFCIVDLHAITVPQEPKELKEKILEVAALYIASGIDPQKSTIFIQSDRPEHSELAWILNCFTSMGELNRMTQFKEKTEGKNNYSVGLFDYPALMAADILLYQTTHVPVGEDQKQHIEITRDLAQRINNKYACPDSGGSDVFTVPEPMIKKETARIMGLDDPTKKMSKSASSPMNYIAMTDDDETIRAKIKKAVTDSGSEIKAGEDKPAITNLLNIFAGVSGKSVSEIEQEFKGPEGAPLGGKTYGEFKEALAEAVIAELSPVREKFEEIIKDKENLRKILKAGAEKVAPEAQATLSNVKEKIGLGL
ncbi:MAG: tryptophan--tRNA ligase [bacterium]